MPCDTRYETTPMSLGALPDSAMIARVLTGDGWTVDHSKGAIRATKGGATLTIGAKGPAILSAPNYSRVDAAALTQTILQGYARESTLQTTAKFGFKLASERALAGGVKELTFTRQMGAKAFGKVGL